MKECMDSKRAGRVFRIIAVGAQIPWPCLSVEVWNESFMSRVREDDIGATMNLALPVRRLSSARPGFNVCSFGFFLVSFAVSVYSGCLSIARVRLFLEPTEAKWSP